MKNKGIEACVGVGTSRQRGRAETRLGVNLSMETKCEDFIAKIKN